MMEFYDLDAPGKPLYGESVRRGASPWSRVVLKSS
jgi:hypothetical protein